MNHKVKISFAIILLVCSIIRVSVTRKPADRPYKSWAHKPVYGDLKAWEKFHEECTKGE